MNKKKIIIGIVFLLIGYCLFVFIKFGFDNTKEMKYCGMVTKCYMTNAGYKVSSKKHIVFYNDLLKRNIDVIVTNNTYANIVEGQIVCFNLNRMQLEQ